jgi:hypothetical protein
MHRLAAMNWHRLVWAYPGTQNEMEQSSDNSHQLIWQSIHLSHTHHQRHV